MYPHTAQGWWADKQLKCALSWLSGCDSIRVSESLALPDKAKQELTSEKQNKQSYNLGQLARTWRLCFIPLCISKLKREEEAVYLLYSLRERSINTSHHKAAILSDFVWSQGYPHFQDPPLSAVRRSMISQFFILSARGDPIIYRDCILPSCRLLWQHY